MSQKKIDSRRLTKGDMIHAAKKRFKVITLVVAIVLVCLGVGAGFISYNQGYKSGNSAGFVSGYQMYSSAQAAKESADAESSKSEAGETETGASSTTAANETEAETEASAETTVAE